MVGRKQVTAKSVTAEDTPQDHNNAGIDPMQSIAVRDQDLCQAPVGHDLLG
jgi:hypothetical protein